MVGQNAPNALWQNATVENHNGAKCHMPENAVKKLARYNLFDSNDLEKYVFFFILFSKDFLFFYETYKYYIFWLTLFFEKKSPGSGTWPWS